MIIVHCPNCELRVVADADGNCPSCHKSLENARAQTTSTTLDETELSSENDSLRHSSSLQEKVGHFTDNTPTHFDLLWVLFSLRGRIPRSIFWLASVGGPMVLYLIFLFAKAFLNETPQLGWIGFAAYCTMFWSSIAVSVKRLHDLNWTGWLVLVGMIPGFGQVFILFTAGMIRGTRGANNYGSDPLKLLE